MSNSIITHNFNGKEISQLSKEANIGSLIVPKGYVSATEICKVEKKKINDYFRLKRSKAYIEALSKSTGIPVDSLVVINESVGENWERGTWVHPDLAISIASWTSAEFEVWANKTLRLIINGDFQPLTEEAAKAEDELRSRWEKIRARGKLARRSLTNSIKDWYERNPNGTTRPDYVMYAQTTNAIYERIWRINAKDLEEFLGCGRHQSRDYLSEGSLVILDRAEDRVAEYIDEDNVKPCDAPSISKLRMKSQPKKKQ